MEVKDGGPVFPGDRYEKVRTRDGMIENRLVDFAGITIRDWFAGIALLGQLANPDTDALGNEQTANSAYQQADMMLKARNNGNP